MSKIRYVLLLASITLISACAFDPEKPSYDYVKPDADRARLVKVSGEVRKNVPLFNPPPRVEICGADDRIESGLEKKIANIVYLSPGEHTLCVRVNTGINSVLAYLLQAIHDKNITFNVEYPNEYVIYYEINFWSYSFVVKDSKGNIVPVKEGK